MMESIHENRLLSGWARYLSAPPQRRNAIHEADCELVALGQGGERLLALTVDGIDEELALGLYRSPRTAGRIAATAALSDLAAVGADPLGLLLSVCLPRRSTEEVQRSVALGVEQACRAAGTFVLGGDTNEGDALRVACVGAGTVPAGQALRRVGASASDLVFASGPLGAGAALAAVRFLELPEAWCPEDSFAPPCRLRHGQALRGVASACMDTSDGLVATLDQLARLGRVRIELEAEVDALLEPRARAIADALALPALPFLAATHGEFELVFTVPEARLDALALAARALEWSPIRLGRVVHGAGVFVGGRALDTARIRNLAGTIGGDPTGYVAALLRACG